MEYPILIELKNRPILMVGAGKVGARKAKEVIQCGGNLTVIAPLGEKDFADWEEAGLLKWYRREFSVEDLNGFEFIFVVTDSDQVNKEAVAEAIRRKLWINSGDKNYPGNFALPALHRQGDILVTVSTNGKSPGVAKQIREILEEEFDENWQRYLQLVEETRNKLRMVGTSKERQEFWQKFFEDSMIELIREDRFEEIERKIRDRICDFKKVD